METTNPAPKTVEQLQDEFLELAQSQGVDPKLFGEYAPFIQYSEANPNPSLPTIAYVHTGGTLVMGKSEGNDEVLSFENAIDLEGILDVCDTVSDIRKKFNIIGINLASLDSKEIRPDAWTAMAATIKTIYSQVDGVVAGHGTHTAEYSATAVAYALRNIAIPIVFTASQIPSIGHCGSDGIPNLTGSMQIAAEADLAEVVTYANGTIHRGTRCNKANDSRLDIFESRITGPIGYFGAEGIEIVPGARRRAGKRKHEIQFLPEFNPSILSIKLNPSVTPEVMRELLKGTSHAVGAIIETYGSGALPNNLVPVLQDALSEGTPIFLTSSCGQSGISAGMLNHDQDAIAAHEAGVRNARDMTTGAATTKLMHIMAHKDLPTDTDKLLEYIEEEMTGKSYAGEVTLVNQEKEDF